MRDLSKYKVGVVLIGGGAKGAYEIGCWKALSEETGMRLAAISGTSIGGINGFLMSVVDFEEAQRIWIDMGRNSPLRFSLSRLIVAFLERLGVAWVLAIQIFVFLPLVTLLAFAVTGVIASLCYVILPRTFFPLVAVLPPLVSTLLIGLATLARGGRINKFTRGGLRFSFRESRRDIRHLVPVEFAALFGLALGIIIPVAMLAYYCLARSASWAWMLLLLPCFALGVLKVFLSSDVGFSSPGEISFVSTEGLEEVLAEHIKADKSMPLQPRLYVSRMREDVVSMPNSLPKWMDEVVREIAPNKPWAEWTLQDLQTYRGRLSEMGLSSYFTNSTTAVLGLEYVQLAGSSMLETADCILSTSAIADVLGRVQQRPQGLEKEDFVLSSMRAEFYDPGLVDNTPIAPLLQNEDCDFIFVIFLDHKIKDSDEYLKTQLSQINDRIRKLNPDLDDETYGSLKSLPFLGPVRTATSRLLDVQVIPLIPS
jgi:predicted acylesterase/phospholipase RssA